MSVTDTVLIITEALAKIIIDRSSRISPHHTITHVTWAMYAKDYLKALLLYLYNDPDSLGVYLHQVTELVLTERVHACMARCRNL